jgi:hypothetical protein
MVARHALESHHKLATLKNVPLQPLTELGQLGVTVRCHVEVVQRLVHVIHLLLPMVALSVLVLPLFLVTLMIVALHP